MREKNKSLREELLDIPKCSILGVNIAAITMNQLVQLIEQNIQELKGKYICVSNVHTTVMACECENYRIIQNEALLAIPNGGPLSTIGKKRGFETMERTTGPGLMEEIFKQSREKKYKHYFYGSTQETLEKLELALKQTYKDIQIVGSYSPPFRETTKEEDQQVVETINEINPDFVWVGLGAPKQEQWMYKQREKLQALMIGVGAGFDYYAGNIKRAPSWMQKNNLEWVYRLLQDPKRLFKRYVVTNTKFIWKAVIKEG